MNLTGLPVMQKPPKPARDKGHLAFVRERGCVICGRPAQAHHLRVGLRTMGRRVSDYLTLPLCEEHHTELHSGREEDFWDRHGVELALALAAALVELRHAK